ncbi:MAG: SPFH domain-containing protein [Alphaproteobacteria bacterium]
MSYHRDYGDPSILEFALNHWDKGLIGLAAVAWATSGIHSLNKNEAKVMVGFFGGPKGYINKPGLNLTMPWPLTKTYARVSQKKSMMKDELYAKTANNVTLTIPIETEYRISDPEKYAYVSDDVEGIIKQKVARAVKSEVNELEYEEVVSEKSSIMSRIKNSLDDELENEYGIELIDVIVDEPRPEQKIEDALNRREAAKLAEEAGTREGNAEAVRIEEMAKGIIHAAETHKASAIKAGFKDATSVIALAQRHIAITDANKGAANLIMDISSQGAAEILGAGYALRPSEAEEQDNNPETSQEDKPEAPGMA